MKGILEFNLPEENEEFKAAQKGLELKRAAVEFDDFIKTVVKVSTPGELNKQIYENIYQHFKEIFAGLLG